ncbi:hypothetical protein MTBUT4_180086 [Magnetospirillum sp. UT-4]|nr:hypothetical protein MTBUT4_180086 [Magnetospirillum sp. UT-4]
MRDTTSPTRRSTCRCCEVLATDSPAAAASPSTPRSPWASNSSRSSRCGLDSALATAANCSSIDSLGLTRVDTEAPSTIQLITLISPRPPRVNQGAKETRERCHAETDAGRNRGRRRAGVGSGRLGRGPGGAGQGGRPGAERHLGAGRRQGGQGRGGADHPRHPGP